MKITCAKLERATLQRPANVSAGPLNLRFLAARIEGRDANPEPSASGLKLFDVIFWLNLFKVSVPLINGLKFQNPGGGGNVK